MGADGTSADSRLGRLEAEVHGLRSEFASLREDIRATKAQPKAHVWAILISVVTALLAVGTFALTPVTQNVSEVKERLTAIERHDNDGHPDAVIGMIRSMDEVHTRERQVNGMSILRFEDRLDTAEKELAILQTIADERTERFKRALELRDEKIDLRAGDRWTGSQQRVFAKGIEQRLRELERRANADQ